MSDDTKTTDTHSTPAPGSTPSPPSPAPRRRQSRRELQLQALVGFLGFFAAIAFAQAIVNVLSPDPQVWPAALALVLVIATASAARAWLRSSGRS